VSESQSASPLRYGRGVARVRVERATTRLILLDPVAVFLRGSDLLPQGSHSRGLVTPQPNTLL
jgi:hypothetical protein